MKSNYSTYLSAFMRREQAVRNLHRIQTLAQTVKSDPRVQRAEAIIRLECETTQLKLRVEAKRLNDEFEYLSGRYPE